MRRKAHRGHNICTLLHADVACEGWLLSDRPSQASRRLDGWMEGELKLPWGRTETGPHGRGQRWDLRGQPGIRGGNQGATKSFRGGESTNRPAASYSNGNEVASAKPSDATTTTGGRPG